VKSALIAALVAAVVVTGGAAAPASAVTDCTVAADDLTWGFKESFRSYISGTIANGEWTVADGANYTTPDFSWAGGSGTFDGATSTGQLDFSGSITFTGHGGILNTTVANPSIRFDDAGTAVVIVDVSGTTQQGDAVDAQDVEFVTVDLASSTVSSANSVLTFAQAPTALTAEGAAAFGTYEAGEAFDPVTINLTVAPGCELVVPEPAAESPDFTWAWIALGAVLALALAATALIVVRRRRSRQGA
jgi:hypothetical protein